MELLVEIDDPVPYDVSLEDEILSPEPPMVEEAPEVEEPTPVVVPPRQPTPPKPPTIIEKPIVQPLLIPSTYGDSSNDYFDNISHLAPSESHGSVMTPFMMPVSRESTIDRQETRRRNNINRSRSKRREDSFDKLAPLPPKIIGSRIDTGLKP